MDAGNHQLLVWQTLQHIRLFYIWPSKKSILLIQRKSQVLFVYHVLESPRVSESRSPRIPTSPLPHIPASPRPASPRPTSPRPTSHVPRPRSTFSDSPFFQLLSNHWWRMEFLAFECIRISRKWNISTVLEQWRLELVQSKCIIGCQGGLYKSFVARGIVILGRHLVRLWIFSFFLEIYFQV